MVGVKRAIAVFELTKLSIGRICRQALFDTNAHCSVINAAICQKQTILGSNNHFLIPCFCFVGLDKSISIFFSEAICSGLRCLMQWSADNKKTNPSPHHHPSCITHYKNKLISPFLTQFSANKKQNLVLSSDMLDYIIFQQVSKLKCGLIMFL